MNCACDGKSAAMSCQNLWMTLPCLCMFVVKLAKDFTSKDFAVVGGRAGRWKKNSFECSGNLL